MEWSVNLCFVRDAGTHHFKTEQEARRFCENSGYTCVLMWCGVYRDTWNPTSWCWDQRYVVNN